MPRIDAARRTDRMSAILDAAERSFARAGFHAASMHDICAEAGMSPGNLYRYFPSKEAIIVGLCERDLAEAAEGFAEIATADNLWDSFRALLVHHLAARPREQVAVWIETMSEAMRNPPIEAMRIRADAFVEQHLRGVLETARSRGQTAPGANIDRTVQFLITHADGLMLRRVRDPDFDPVPQIDVMVEMFRSMLLAPQAPTNDNAQ